MAFNGFPPGDFRLRKLSIMAEQAGIPAGKPALKLAYIESILVFPLKVYFPVCNMDACDSSCIKMHDMWIVYNDPYTEDGPVISEL